MRLLIVSATSAEASGLFPDSIGEVLPGHSISLESSRFDVELLITGVGSVATAFQLGCRLQAHHYEMALNIGLAGTFREDWLLGKVLKVKSDCFADLGAEDHDAFLDLFDLQLADPDQEPFKNKELIPIPFPHAIALPTLDEAVGITVNKVHGNNSSIALIKKRFPADLESMEGAAFFYACNLMRIPSMQIRAISNRVEPRNRDNWDIKKALEALTLTVKDLMK